MKMAITAQGPEPGSLVDLRFGRARYFRIVDTETGQQTAVHNAEGADAVQGAGVRAGQTLARLGVQALITGHVGPKAWSALQAANIRVYAVEGGTVAQAAQAFMAGQLREVAQPDVRGHWA
jgi:predicted Fe-Mo cluster-binding NifX family protein